MAQKNPNNRALYFLLTVFLTVFMTFAVPGVARAEMEDHPVVKLQSLDKTTARTMTFEVKVGSIVKFGPLYIKVQACRKAPPIEQPESAAFLQIWEFTPEEKAKWVFSGWMFASSPALSPMDHPIYDVWVIDCLGAVPAASPAPEEGPEEGNAEGAATEDPVPEGAPETAKPPEEKAAVD